MRLVRTVVFLVVTLSLSIPLALVAGCSNKPFSDLHTGGASASRSLRNATPQALRQWRVGDTWEYDYTDAEPGTLTIKVVRAVPRPDIGGQDLTCAYSIRYYRGLSKAERRRMDHSTEWGVDDRQYVFTQYADGSLTSQGAIDGDGRRVFPWAAGAVLPTLRSPLTVGQPLSIPNSGVNSATNGRPTTFDFSYEVVGVEDLYVNGKSVPCYRLDVKTVDHWERDGEQKTDETGWTDWYNGDFWLVKRKQRNSLKIFGVPVTLGLSLQLNKFTPGL